MEHLTDLSYLESLDSARVVAGALTDLLAALYILTVATLGYLLSLFPL